MLLVMVPGGDVATAPLIGGRYELETMLGRGGAGEVWRARHVTLESHVAIKFLHGASSDSESMRKRFLTEARVAAQLKTRYAVHVYDFGITEDGRPYLVMELLDGETLGHRLRRQTSLPVPVTARFMSQAARALDRAHALGIVHRDFKPENIVIVSDEDGKESIKVLDFGVAKLVRDLVSEGPTAALDAGAEVGAVASLTSFTRTGSLLGTPCYMAPEQILNAPDLDLHADIWALGVVAFECLTGALPFVGENMVDLFARIQCGMHALARVLNPELPRRFEEWFDTACAIDPARRFASATRAAEKLAEALGESPATARPSSGSEPVLRAGELIDTPARMAPTVLEVPEKGEAPEKTTNAPPPLSSAGGPPSSGMLRAASTTPPPSSRRAGAGRTIVPLSADEAVVLAGWRNVVVSIWRASPSAATIARVAQALDAFAAKQPAGIVMIAVLEGERAIPTEETRKLLAHDMKMRERYTRAIAFVYEGEGFVAASARSVASGIVLASGRKGARTFASTTEAVAWLSQMRMLKGTPPQELLDVIEKVRRESAPAGAR
jgi:serine/threonine protein kinase